MSQVTEKNTIVLLACGHIGLGVAECLLKHGWRVIGVRRQPPAIYPNGMEWVPADLTDPATLSRIPPSHAVLFTPSPRQRDAAVYREWYETMVGAILAHVVTWPDFRLWLHVSSTSVYGQDAGETITEETAPLPATAMGKLILQAEQYVQSILGNRCCVVRFSGIYGFHRTHFLRRVARTEAMRQQHMTNRIHQEDCAGFLVHLLARAQQNEVLESVYLGTDTMPVDEWTLGVWLAHKLGLEPPPVLTAEPSGKRCLSVHMAQSGYQLQYPTYQEGYGAEISV